MTKIKIEIIKMKNKLAIKHQYIYGIANNSQSIFLKSSTQNLKK